MSDVSDVLQHLYRGDQAGAEAAAATRSALDVFEAAALGRVERIAELATADGGCVRDYAGDGFTPLQLAAFFGRTEAARTLLALGADVGAASRNPMQLQALHSAAARGAHDLMVLLLDAGADADARQAGGYTALQSRASHGDLAGVKLLLARGATPLAAAEDGRTALDLAREKGHQEVVALLESTI
jgi:uncharacterized protein